MAKDPKARYESVAEFQADLESLLAGAPAKEVGKDSSIPDYIKPREQLQAEFFVTQMNLPAKKSKFILYLAIAAVSLSILSLPFLMHFWGNRQPGNGGNQSIPGKTTPGNPKLNTGGNSPAGDPIKVGILHSQTGTMASSEVPVIDATLLAIKEINVKGGLLGRQVKAVVRDGQSNDKTFEQEALRLVNEDKVSAVFGCWTSSSRKHVQDIFEKQNHLLFYPVQYEGLERSPNIIYAGTTPNQQIIPVIDWAIDKLGKKNFFLVGSDYIFPHAANAIIKDHLQYRGVNVVGEAYIPMGSTDATGVVKKIDDLNKDPNKEIDVILNTINGHSNQSCFIDRDEAGIKPDKVPVFSITIGKPEMKKM
ncbi:MAG: transporter substrate-binding protein, partial [Planctomycetales bacterium]